MNTSLFLRARRRAFTSIAIAGLLAAGLVGAAPASAATAATDGATRQPAARVVPADIAHLSPREQGRVGYENLVKAVPEARLSRGPSTVREAEALLRKAADARKLAGAASSGWFCTGWRAFQGESGYFFNASTGKVNVTSPDLQSGLEWFQICRDDAWFEADHALLSNATNGKWVGVDSNRRVIATGALNGNALIRFVHRWSDQYQQDEFALLAPYVSGGRWFRARFDVSGAPVYADSTNPNASNWNWFALWIVSGP